MNTDIAIKRKIDDFIIEYQIKKENIQKAIKNFEQAGTDLQTACSVNGTYGQTRIDVGSVYERHLEENLLKSAWLTIYNTPGMKTVMTAKDHKKFQAFITAPTDFTMENIQEQFGDYVANPWGSILRGLAEVFCDLDQSFKSHEKVKIGVKGLPKRIILTGFGGFSDYGWRKLTDVVNALASLKNEKMFSHYELERILEKDGEYFLKDHYDDKGDEVVNIPARGFYLRLFNNGNGHLFFTPETLADINRALAEYYGEVLADCHEDKPTERQQSTEVSKDLQYYPTPKNVVDSIISNILIEEGTSILEPSCGCGRLMDGVWREVTQNHIKNVRMMGVEFDPERAEQAKAKGHSVLIANFLETEPEPKFDRIIMNPPFYGKHYAKHVNHAFKFLKEGGTLTAILPVTARYDHGLLDGHWSDLPVGAFRESGVNINTTVLTMEK